MSFILVRRCLHLLPVLNVIFAPSVVFGMSWAVTTDAVLNIPCRARVLSSLQNTVVAPLTWIETYPAGLWAKLILLFWIWCFHGGDCEKYRLLGCNGVSLGERPTLRCQLSPPFSGSKNKLGNTPAGSRWQACCWFIAWFTLGPWIWRQYGPPKRRAISALHGVTIHFTVVSVIYCQVSEMLPSHLIFRWISRHLLG
jgi:hypothetical protein